MAAVNVKNPPPPLRPLMSEEAMPLYRQVKRELQKLIEAGHYGPGKPLPSEADIAAGLQVSVGTLRHAVDELVHEHVLVRRQGKGTFVAPHNNARFMFQFFHVEPRWNFGDDDAARDRDYPEIDCIAFGRERATEHEAAALQGRVVMHDRLTIAAALFRNLTEKRVVERPGTIYALYQTDFGITVLRAQERARAAAADRAQARLLGVAVGAPVMEVHRLALTFGDKPVEYRVSTINTQAHDYVSVLSKKA
jgi:GntR family transcriptional regulator